MQSDNFTQKAIERRRKDEEERKKRFFNDKQRTIGVDMDYLEKQLKEKEQKKQAEAQRELDYVRYLERADQLRGQVEQERTKTLEKRQRAENEQNSFMKANPHLRREFYLNDPLLLKKSHPPRMSDADPNCGVSSIQIMEGEDLGRDERVKRQQREIRDWVAQIKQEKDGLRAKEEFLTKIEVEYLAKLNKKLRELEEAAQHISSQRTQNTVNFNIDQAHAGRPKIVEDKFIPSEDFFLQFNTSSR